MPCSGLSYQWRMVTRSFVCYVGLGLGLDEERSEPVKGEDESTSFHRWSTLRLRLRDANSKDGFCACVDGGPGCRVGSGCVVFWLRCA